MYVQYIYCVDMYYICSGDRVRYSRLPLHSSSVPLREQDKR